ncbi:SusD-like starch-binding protein associating with outer membrane [Neolewinella xylanilytica]|uniref:SusD-like starch-binding protein associating with outer membrane n=1 Tax=Neolewinella xylanilytica TaxID=1514080 RepID=A0A2S6I1D2_9BACT|nr:SusD/RagB family nutrient-binding outer membrane lipoprotein [Neolewinella xylanilytica]PPK84683.1 SusD-like starch-binding protein associating with outer membrane [Neolewinella xylanilytica]
MRICFFLLSLLLLHSCTDDFAEINTNPNEAERVTGDLLLRTVTFDLASNHVNNVQAFGDVVAQYAANYEFNDIDIYQWGADARFWGLYAVIQDARDIQAYGVETGQPDYEAVALTLQAYMFSILTDAYGDVPYTEAGRAESDGIFAPAYDPQEDIYAGLLADLARANTLFTGATIAGDNLFGGDTGKWRRFANSLRVRLLLRASEAMDVSDELTTMLNDPTTYPLFAGNADNAIYDFTGTLPNVAPIAAPVGRTYEYFLRIPTTNLVELLKTYEDPRLQEWLDPNGFPDYLGVDPGQTLGDIGRPDAFSTKDTSYFSDPGKLDAIFMTYSELNFLLAEAAERGLIDDDPEAYYRSGVAASFDQWGVALPADYFSGAAAWIADDALELIARQKWLSLWHNTTEAWFDWKRTGLPSFIAAGPGTVNAGAVPVRLLYPSIEQSVNPENYATAAERIGGDDINSRVWYDQ